MKGKAAYGVAGIIPGAPVLLTHRLLSRIQCHRANGIAVITLGAPALLTHQRASRIQYWVAY